jgi:hypothetical protein
MENEHIQQSQSSDQITQLVISNVAVFDLKETAKWAKFLGIFGFVLTAIMILVGIFAGTLFSFIPEADTLYAKGTNIFLSVFYILIGTAYYFPSMYMYRFSKKLASAVQTNNSNDLDTAFRNQKSLYKFMGVLAVIMLGFYAIALFFIALGALFTAL